MTGRGDPVGLAEAAGAALGRSVLALSPCAGGDINRAFHLELEGGDSAFLKYRTGATVEEFAAEAAGLGWLAEPGAIRVPRVLAVLGGEGSPGLILEWLDQGPALSAAGEEELGRGLALLHRSGADFHGQRPPGAGAGPVRLGQATLAPPAGETVEFARLYAERIDDLTRRALSGGGLDRDEAAQISLLAEAIGDFSGPSVPPARLHGDLWSGNVMTGGDGEPWLIDPAAYGGHPEVDLAMLELFGSPSQRFYEAYEEVSPLPDGRHDRVSLWQIQPLLVHAVLFGGHYGAAAARAAGKYTRP